MSDEFSPEIADSQDISGGQRSSGYLRPLLGAHGFAVYMALTRNATNGTGECKLSTSKLAAQLGMSKGGVFNALGLLVKLNLAKRIHAGDPRHPAIYVLADVKALVNPTYAQLRLAPRFIR